MKKIINFCKKFVVSILIILNMLPLGIFSWQPKPQEVKADSTPFTKDTQIDWQAGKFENGQIDITSTPGDIKLQTDLGSWDATGSADIGHYVYPNTAMVKVGRFAYVFRNRYLGQMTRYDLDTGEWKQMASLPTEPYEVLDATTNGTDTIYAFATRANRKDFVKYDINTDTWSYLTDTPNSLQQGSTLEYVSGGTDYVYALRGGNSTDFWRYNINTKGWQSLTNTTARCTTYCDLVFDGSQYLYAMIDYSTDRLYRYDTKATTPTWGAVGTGLPDGSSYYPSNLTYADGNIYMLKGNATKTFYKYNGSSWSAVTNLPYPTTYGATIYDGDNSRVVALTDIGTMLSYFPYNNTWSNPLRGPLLNAYDTGQTLTADSSGNVYLCRGQSTAICYKYNTTTPATDWTTLTLTTGTLGAGTAMTWMNNLLYVGKGGSTSFYSVDPSTGTATILAVTSANFSIGSSMTASDSSKLYVLHGNGTTFRRYLVGTGWSNLANFPTTAYYGSSIVKAGPYIYGLNAYNQGKFYRYKEIENAWEEVASLPVAAYRGAALSYDNTGYIYAQVGGDDDVRSRQFYRYSTTTGQWQRLADTPQMIRNGGGLTFYGSALYSYQGYSGGFWKYTPPSGGARVYNNAEKSIWNSPVYDLTGVSSFDSFSADDVEVDGVADSIVYKSRTSDDGNVWDNWEPVDANLNSTNRRYLQIRIELKGKSDGSETPVVHSFTVNYTPDDSGSDVTSLNLQAYSATGGAQLVSGTTYNHRNPYFQWDPAVDSISGLDGYNVYFGTESDPSTGWAFQNQANYTATTGVISGSTYYFIVKAKDKIGNLSDPVSFNYVYSGISVGTPITLTSQVDWDNNEATKSAVYASGTDWWNANYAYRQSLTITPSSTVGPGTIVKTVVDTSALMIDGKLRNDLKDWRIVYKDGSIWKEIDRNYADGTTTYFALQKGINNGSSDANYYIYYGNANETSAPMSNLSTNSKASAKWGTSLAFGTTALIDDYVKIPSSINTKPKLTIEGWFYYYNTAATRWIYGDDTGTPQVGVGVATNGNSSNLIYNFRTTGTTFTSVYGTTVLVPGTWNHFAVVYDSVATTYKAYVNGRLDYSRPTAVTGNVSITTNQRLGSAATTYYYGFLDEFRISDSARYLTNFTATSSAFINDGNTLALYHMDEATGQSLTDSSGHSNNGTLGSAVGPETNDPSWTGAITASVTSNETYAVTVPTPEDNGLTLEPLTNGSWAGYQVSSLPWGGRMQYGASVVAGNDLYVLRGRATTVFYKQDLTTGNWTQLTDTTTTAYYGSAMAYDGNDSIYAVMGTATSNFYKYTISTNTWSTPINQPTVTFTYGASLTVGKDKDGNDVIYALAGGSQNFVVYYLSGDSIGTWASKTSITTAATTGAGIVYDSAAGAVWAVIGSNILFYKYSITDESWDTTITAPVNIPYYTGYASNNLILYGDYVYTFSSYDYQANNERKNFIWRYKKSSGLWESVRTETEFWPYTGAVAYDGSRYAYLIQGYDTSTYLGNSAITRFDLETYKFLPESSPLPLDRTYNNDGETIVHQPYTGTSLAFDDTNDEVYMIQGGTVYVNKYNTSTKQWTIIPHLPCQYSGGMVHTGSALYVVCGNGTTKMYKYTSLTNNWIQMADTPATMSTGNNQILAYDGNSTIYALRGVSSATLYKYTINSEVGAWDTESASGGPTIYNNYGAWITYDGSDYLYVSTGALGTFHRYKLTSPIGWSTLTSPPEIFNYGSSGVYNSGKIYTMAGNQNTGNYVYDTTTGSWSYGPDTMSQVYAGGAMVKGHGSTAYALQGNNNFTFWKYNLPSATSSYKFHGTYSSKSIDLGSPYDIAGMIVTVASPSATSVGFETRSSTDSANWSVWTAVDQLKKINSTSYTYRINSSVKKYIQIKATLNSDESASTPIISDITIDYYADTTAPINPTTLTSYETATKAANQVLQDYKWYNKATPYFEWTGDTDGAGGSGIAGYYVYFDHSETVDASASGTFQTAANYTASLATDGTDDGEYFLKIQPVDNAGNISTSTWSPFHYRYDHTAPVALGTISVDPRIYTFTNDFDMTWTAITDQLSNSTGSGLLGYRYQASSSAVIFNDLFTTEASVSGDLAYEEGTNVFSVRAEDNAGNSTSYKTASFYYNITPPSAPYNLKDVTNADDAGANKYTFQWERPTTLKGEYKEFRYAINSLPLDDSNISTTAALLVSNQRGTKNGTNVFRVVAVDEAGNVDYDNYASVDFEVNITAPGTPLTPEAFDNSIRNTESYRVGLTWDKPTDMGSAFDRYEIYASEEEVECSTSMDDYILAGTTAGTSDGGSYVVTSINNEKLESTTYYLCVLACSSSNQCSSPSTTVDMLPSGRWLIAPEMTASPSATIKTKSANITWSTSRTSNSFVKYGTATGDYGNEVGSSEQVTAHDIDLTELSPGTVYYYKVLWSDEDGNQGESQEYTLTTNPAPSISSVKLSNVSIYSAYVAFKVKNAIKATVKYGKSTSYGGTETISTSKTETTYTIQLANLTEGTIYHLQIVAEDDEANQFSGDDYTFTTLPVPKITNLKIQQVANMATATLRLTWTSNTPISSIVTYYPTGMAEQAKDQISLVLKKTHEVILKNMKDDTEYTLVIKGKDSVGNETAINTQKIKTSTDLRAPEIINMNVESTIVGVGDSAKAQIIVSWDTDEVASTQVEYAQGTGTTYGQSTQEDTNPTLNHVVTITGLTPSKIYHLRAISKDKSNNIGLSFDTVVITPKSTKDALNLVIDNLSKTFGFLNNLKK